MNTLRKFITYYSPYKTVFFIDLLCAAFISIVDLAYPQYPARAVQILCLRKTAVSSFKRSAFPLQPDFFSCT